MLKVNEVAERLRVKPLTVYRWIKSGKLVAIKIDGILRIEDEVYAQFIGKGKDRKTGTVATSENTHNS